MLIDPKIVNKRWGREIWFANNLEKDYCGKVIEINAGSKLSLHFHVVKEEHLFLFKGDCELTYLNKDGTNNKVDLKEGQSFHIRPGVVHRFSTINGCILLEASTYHMDEDSYRVSL